MGIGNSYAMKNVARHKSGEATMKLNNIGSKYIFNTINIKTYPV